MSSPTYHSFFVKKVCDFPITSKLSRCDAARSPTASGPPTRSARAFGAAPAPAECFSDSRAENCGGDHRQVFLHSRKNLLGENLCGFAFLEKPQHALADFADELGRAT